MTVEQIVDIRSAQGLHARPAGQLVQLAARFQSEIELATGTDSVSVRSLLGLLRLGLRQGDQVRVRATGPDAAAAVAAVAAFLNGENSGGEAEL